VDSLDPVVRENAAVNAIAMWLGGSPLPARWALAAAVAAGAIGNIVGLIVGLHVYAPTAPFAAIEIGLPAAVVGGLVGLVSGAIVTVSRRIKATPDDAGSC
jgi:hypothetical protein